MIKAAVLQILGCSSRLPWPSSSHFRLLASHHSRSDHNAFPTPLSASQILSASAWILVTDLFIYCLPYRLFAPLGPAARFIPVHSTSFHSSDSPLLRDSRFTQTWPSCPRHPRPRPSMSSSIKIPAAPSSMAPRYSLSAETVGSSSDSSYSSSPSPSSPPASPSSKAKGKAKAVALDSRRPSLLSTPASPPHSCAPAVHAIAGQKSLPDGIA